MEAGTLNLKPKGYVHRARQGVKLETGGREVGEMSSSNRSRAKEERKSVQELNLVEV